MYYVVWITRVVSATCSVYCCDDQLNELSCSWFEVMFDVYDWLLDLVLCYTNVAVFTSGFLQSANFFTINIMPIHHVVRH